MPSPNTDNTRRARLEARVEVISRFYTESTRWGGGGGRLEARVERAEVHRRPGGRGKQQAGRRRAADDVVAVEPVDAVAADEAPGAALHLVVARHVDEGKAGEERLHEPDEGVPARLGDAADARGEDVVGAAGRVVVGVGEVPREGDDVGDLVAGQGQDAVARGRRVHRLPPPRVRGGSGGAADARGGGAVAGDEGGGGGRGWDDGDRDGEPRRSPVRGRWCRMGKRGGMRGSGNGIRGSGGGMRKPGSPDPSRPWQPSQTGTGWRAASRRSSRRS